MVYESFQELTSFRERNKITSMNHFARCLPIKIMLKDSRFIRTRVAPKSSQIRMEPYLSQRQHFCGSRSPIYTWAYPHLASHELCLLLWWCNWRRSKNFPATPHEWNEPNRFLLFFASEPKIKNIKSFFFL